MTKDHEYRRTGQTGFTLTELMVAVAIAGILAAVAIPAYTDYVKDSRRSMAKQGLLELAAGMQQCAMDPPAGADSFDECADGSNKPLTQYFSSNTNVHPVLEFYDFTITASDATAKFNSVDASYLLTATPKGVQSGDGNLRLYSDGRRAWHNGTTWVAWED